MLSNSLIKDSTEPSKSGNAFEGVEDRLNGLRILTILAMKAHERRDSCYTTSKSLVMYSKDMIYPELYRNIQSSEIKSSEDNTNVDAEKAHGINRMVPFYRNVKENKLLNSVDTSRN